MPPRNVCTFQEKSGLDKGFFPAILGNIEFMCKNSEKNNKACKRINISGVPFHTPIWKSAG
jgi:hypothetical protein